MNNEFASHSLFNDSKCLSYFKLESTADSKGSNTLTNNGSTPFNAAKFNNGADFGSSNSSKYFSIANDLGITSSVSVSICGWINITTAPATNARICAFSLASSSVLDRGLALFYKDTAGTKQLSVFSGGNDTILINQTLTIGTWYHLAVVRNSPGGVCILYLNGVRIAGAASGGAPLGGFANFTIGADESAANFMTGIIDDLVVFNRMLTDAEMMSIYKNDRTITGISTITGLSTLTM